MHNIFIYFNFFFSFPIPSCRTWQMWRSEVYAYAICLPQRGFARHTRANKAQNAAKNKSKNNARKSQEIQKSCVSFTTIISATMNTVLGKYRLLHKFRLAKCLFFSPHHMLSPPTKGCIVVVPLNGWHVVDCGHSMLHATALSIVRRIVMYVSFLYNISIVWVSNCLAPFCCSCCCYFNLIFFPRRVCVCLLSYAVNHNCCQTSFWVASFSVRASLVCVVVVAAAMLRYKLSVFVAFERVLWAFYGNQTVIQGVSLYKPIATHQWIFCVSWSDLCFGVHTYVYTYACI